MSNQIKTQVEKMLRNESIENYNSHEELAESIQSEIEQKQDISDAEASMIGEMCEEWFAYQA